MKPLIKILKDSFVVHISRNHKQKHPFHYCIPVERNIHLKSVVWLKSQSPEMAI